MKKIILIVMLLSLALTGCGRVTRGTIDEVIARDPSFKRALEAKKRINAEILKLRNSYKQQKDEAIREIKSLKENLRKEKNTLGSRALSLKQEVVPAIDAIKGKLEKRRTEYNEKKKILKESLSKSKNIGKLLAKKSELSLSADEVSVWNKRASNLEKEITSLRKELDALRSKIRLLKTEIQILKQ